VLLNPSRQALRSWSAILIGWLATASLSAEPYAPGPNSAGTTAIVAFADDETVQPNSELTAWAHAVDIYSPGENVSQVFQTTPGALGPADFTGSYYAGSDTTVTLGDGGSITLSFATPILDTDGFDLVVFENGIPTTGGRGFFELAFVEVSSNGTDFYRFSGRSSTPRPTTPYAFLELNPTDLDGLAGKYPATYGTPFDFAWLGLSSISFVRIVDILGNGETLDADGKPIFDPYPTVGSAGFDLDAVAAHVTQRYETWRKARFAWQDNYTPVSDPFSDADGDGCSNLMEYAFATLPTDPSSRLQPNISLHGQEIQFHFWRDPNKIDLRIAVEASSDMQQWTEIALSTSGQPFLTIPPNVAGITIMENTAQQPHTVTISAPLNQNHLFFRLSSALISSP
jgi:hypothetical protein